MAAKTMRTVLGGILAKDSACWKQFGNRRSISTFGPKMGARELWGMDNKGNGNLMKELDQVKLSEKIYGNYEKVTPQEVSEELKVPDAIQRPNYLNRVDNCPLKRRPIKVHIKTKEEIEIMRESCRLAKFVLESTLKECKVGVSTDDLDKYAHELIIKNEAYPSTLGYMRYPKSICTSVNNVACHGIPDNRKLVNGDIISVDVMVYKNGFHGDCAGTVTVGDVDDAGKSLVRVAEECTSLGIKACGPGVPFRNIGQTIEAHAENLGYNVVPTFTGHGVGRNVHEKPEIYHYDRMDGNKEVMKPGMIFTVEPVITQGLLEIVTILNDGWTAVTVDGARTAQFENTILITDGGVEILTVTDSAKAL